MSLGVHMCHVYICEIMFQYIPIYTSNSVDSHDSTDAQYMQYLRKSYNFTKIMRAQPSFLSAFMINKTRIVAYKPL